MKYTINAHSFIVNLKLILLSIILLPLSAQDLKAKDEKYPEPIREINFLEMQLGMETKTALDLSIDCNSFALGYATGMCETPSGMGTSNGCSGRQFASHYRVGLALCRNNIE